MPTPFVLSFQSAGTRSSVSASDLLFDPSRGDVVPEGFTPGTCLPQS